MNMIEFKHSKFEFSNFQIFNFSNITLPGWPCDEVVVVLDPMAVRVSPHGDNGRHEDAQEQKEGRARGGVDQQAAADHQHLMEREDGRGGREGGLVSIVIIYVVCI
jgi:hypothetical protein